MGAPTLREIIKRRTLLKPVYKTTARHGHFGHGSGADDPFGRKKTGKAASLATAARLKPRENGR